MRIHLLLVMLASCGPHVAPRAQNAQNAVDRAAFAAQRELASARADNDAVKILCERDKAAQIEAIRKSRAERRDEPRVVAALDAKADALRYEVQHCVSVDPSPPCWPIAPMRLVALDGSAVAEMRGDGTIDFAQHGSRKIVGRVSNDVLRDARGAPLVTCVDRDVTVAGTTLKGHYDSNDALVIDGKRTALRDDGTLTLDGAPAGARVEGATADYRRTALLLLFAGVMSAPLMPTP